MFKSIEEGGSPLPKQAGYKGKIIKGSNFDVKTLGTFDKAKMMDLMESGCQDAVLEEVINIYLFLIRKR